MARTVRSRAAYRLPRTPAATVCEVGGVSGPGDVVRRYFDLVAGLDSKAEDLLTLLHPAVRVIERPNRIPPAGVVRDGDEVLAGKRLLAP
jgi:hypothetical protein